MGSLYSGSCTVHLISAQDHGGQALEFINIQPPKGGLPLEFINIQPLIRGSASRAHQDTAPQKGAARL